MTLIEKERLNNLWNRTEKGGLVRTVSKEGCPDREGGNPWSDPSETMWLIKRIEENIEEFGPVLTVLELGVAEGGGAKIWEQVLLTQLKNVKDTKDLLYIGVDWSPNIMWNWKNSPVDIRTVTGNTHNEATRNQVKQILIEKGSGEKIRKIDFLFIDAQHWSVDVKQDFIDYGSFVDENRLIGFHDTRLCRSFWDEFTGGGIDAADDKNSPTGYNIQERMIFHKEEFKSAFGAGLFWKLPTQNVIKFRDV